VEDEEVGGATPESGPRRRGRRRFQDGKEQRGFSRSEGDGDGEESGEEERKRGGEDEGRGEGEEGKSGGEAEAKPARDEKRLRGFMSLSAQGLTTSQEGPPLSNAL
jgi:hypothetical protein